ncbi:hypothetical protein MKQ70_34985 [Chitinophaga sedimenti]|uniref:hypothetical protein n=1 Tax=Chitinophaga sedimenti TaxID=2033606 RepID=UPI002006665B|nr:hypothetical protein [Chitinophaga sedimenti]MCK7559866.1 hypothetical protein [Chitinophaga sedimenti]
MQSAEPPYGLTPALTAMWWDGKGDWDAAHDIAQEITGSTGSYIHAYLHRKEGDPGNAAYWYARAGRKIPKSSLDEEWNDIVMELLRS